MIHITEIKNINLKKRRMYLLCFVPTEWLYQKNGKKIKKNVFFLFLKAKLIYRCMQHAIYQLIQKVIKLDIQSNSSV